MAVHVYAANRSMTERSFYNADGEMLIVPQQGAPASSPSSACSRRRRGEIAVMPRGLNFRVELPDGPRAAISARITARLLRLPELGPLGANGLANARDFLAPVAAYEDTRGPHRAGRQVRRQSVGGRDRPFAARCRRLARQLRALQIRSGALQRHQHGELRPSRSVDLHRADRAHATCPAPANFDFVIFPPRWLVAEDTFRPPWFHRNVMSEFMGLIHGVYDAKAEGFVPGGASLHNCMTRARPRRRNLRARLARRARAAQDRQHPRLHVRDPLRDAPHPLRARNGRILQHEYYECWQGLEKHFKK